MAIKDGQETAYGYDLGDPDQQDVWTSLDTITTVVASWETPKEVRGESN
jgi:hypothetical protein